MNLLFGTSILWLPLTFAAIGRAAFVKYKFTDKRISVATTAPWKGAAPMPAEAPHYGFTIAALDET